jgi:hypothetical protein
LVIYKDHTRMQVNNFKILQFTTPPTYVQVSSSAFYSWIPSTYVIRLMSENAFHTDIKPQTDRQTDLTFMRILIFIFFNIRREATETDRAACEACARSDSYKAVVL